MSVLPYNIKNLVSDEQIEKAFQGTHFGEIYDKNLKTQRDLVAYTLYAFACGFSAGSTITVICRELGLICVPKGKNINLTKKGKRYMYASLCISTGQQTSCNRTQSC